MSIIVRPSGKSSRAFDPTIYPAEETVGEDILQRWIAELLRPLIERWFQEREIPAFVGADQFVYYRQHAPTDRIAPDVYVLPGVRPNFRVTSWKIWEKGIVPSFGLEIVSKDWEKDYVEAPERYAEAGVSELVIFDPAPARHSEGVTWQVFRRVGNRPLRCIEVSQGDRIHSKALGCYLRAVGSDDSLRLTLGTGPGGDDLFPTAEEAERAAKEAALERVAELEAKLRARRPRRAR